MSAYPTPLVPKQVEAGIQAVTFALLGLPAPSAQDDPVYSKVRVGWQTQGQPAQQIADDVVYLRCYGVDDPYNRIREVNTIPNPDDNNTPPQTVLQVTSYHRIWETFWSAYGPNSFDAARKIRSGLFTQKLGDTLATQGLALYLIPDCEEIRRLVEEDATTAGQWLERSDFPARFNEFVTETLVVPIMKSVEVIAYENKAGEFADFVVNLQ